MRKMKVEMMKKTITLKGTNLINTKRTTERVNKRTFISKIKVSIPKRIVAHLKKVMIVSLIVIEKRFSS